ncbi:replication initiation and membrane attachment family protein [Bacillus pumilus]|uniref:replication initiation and membrane attachment family protein n=1 Tax=Bacillus pumilus TaxID=1408 RepID=UPI00119EA931|nr:replication initiation and membrane attachment family protein [Bacillus pumilus]
MTEHWKEVLAVDPYVVKSASLLGDIDRQLITLLYQPLIGMSAFSLYMTLWGELEQNRMWGKPAPHRQLMVMLQTNLNDIFEERLKLEAIGLLRTYEQETEEGRLFTYELVPPLRPDEFFQDGMLNVLLYHRVEKAKYMQLRDYFSYPGVPAEAKNISRSFEEVFHVLQPGERRMTEEINQASSLDQGYEYVTVGSSQPAPLSDDSFDFDLLLAGMSDMMIPRKALTKQVKETIKKLAVVYGITPLQMQNIVAGACGSDQMISTEELRKAARDWYQIEYRGEQPKLIDQKQPRHLRQDASKAPTADTPDAKLIEKLDHISPRELLKDMADGIEPTYADLRIVEDIMLEQQLEPGVMNVLIYYTLLKTDMKLSKTYMQKIAAHWVRKKIKTVAAAMQIAKEENRQMTEWAQQKKQRSTYGSGKVVREEKLPDWMKETETKEQPAKEQTDNLSTEDLEREKEKLLDQFKNMKKYNAH